MIQAEKYRVGMERQLAAFAEAQAAGMPRRGWKVAINVPEVLTHLQLPHSGVGWLNGHAVLASGETYTAKAGAQLLIEPEIAIQIATHVPKQASADQARACIGGIAPALEIVDYTMPTTASVAVDSTENAAEASTDAPQAPSAPPAFDDVVASCMFHGASVLGETRTLDSAEGLGTLWPKLRVENQEAEAARPDLVPDDLGELVCFVAAFLAEFGESLRAGDFILSGSYTAKAMPIAAGEEAFADHGPLGSVSVRIA